MIQVCAYEDLDPWRIFASPAAGFDRSHRFQVLALEGDPDGEASRNLVGRWDFELERVAGQFVIDSTHTWVSGRLRRQGIARRLWRFGVDRYRPITIKATIGTYAGLEFLARMRAELAGLTAIDVDYGERMVEVAGGVREDTWPQWHRRCAEELELELRRERTSAAVAARRGRLEVVK